MSQELSFGDVLEAADQLSPGEQEELVGILRRRLAETARQRLIAEVRDARREFAEGKCQPADPDQLMREILE